MGFLVHFLLDITFFNKETKKPFYVLAFLQLNQKEKCSMPCETIPNVLHFQPLMMLLFMF